MVSYTPIRMSELKSNYGPKYVISVYDHRTSNTKRTVKAQANYDSRNSTQGYHAQPNVAGFTPQAAFRIGSRLAMYGAPAAVAVLLFANGIPRVQRDVLQKIPFLGSYFRKEIHPADNDEVFHIPQAQKYCQGSFREWDDKITTPPGLYLLSLIIPGVIRPSNSASEYLCDVKSLRATNVVVLVILAFLVLKCRREIEARLYEAHTSTRLRHTSQYAVHTALNVALFPLLFFFSGLYYTDVASTAAVLVVYLNHLKRIGRDRSSALNDLTTICLGIVTLFFRQTNVFWVVVYMGGLEAVHAVKTLRPKQVDQPVILTLFEQIKYFAWRYSLGDIHDPPLHMMWPDDMLFCVLSLGIAAICNPIRIIKQVWPYVAVLISFGGFVAWNGGVVLGDKSNHVATIHLPQMLYIWPFFAFFSLPLLVPYALPIINIVLRIMPRAGSPTSTSKAVPEAETNAEPASFSFKSRRSGSSKKDSTTGSSDRKYPRLSKPLEISSFIFEVKLIIWPLYLLATTVLSLAIVRHNTIIHPFTLADNRHYMFYIFRYTIRRASWIRYALVVPYTLSRWMTWGTIAGCSRFFAIHTRACSVYGNGTEKPPFLSHPLVTNVGFSTRQTHAAFPAEITENSQDTSKDQELSKALEDDPILASVMPASTSTGLIFLLATTLSLMTAPLVEPRYFIIPWVMWRLLVPAWRLHDHGYHGDVTSRLSNHPKTRPLFEIFQHYDLRLILETCWFIAINIATGYIFLTKPYIWKAEDGTVLDNGRLQRFMW
ncbi:alpha-1,2 glucosyltransferase ALG10 [Fusarium circinatum]|uniref:Dol-P-Glc:Glc(2)Man(9)GlcNAc(2)-PP-Dol alpha-1,2-glucosyltransferase n=1 Tax=Fusarium circinatum TaxID=48490 RepID=A0A8H5X3U3_FUSCI|nr:alpha-1,2 glucosyltransferase ALG10 [Fusarium circinatum]